MQRASTMLVMGLTLALGCGELQDVLEAIGSEDEHNGAGHHPPPPAADCGATIGVDDLYVIVADDLARLDAEDQPFQRYVSLANRSNAGACGTDLDKERVALNEFVNSVSLSPRLTQPVAIDSARLVYRLDMRDYDWDRSVRVEGVAFADAWEAIIANSPFAVEYAGDDADRAKQDTGTRVPILSFDALASVAAVGSVYYALLDVPGDSAAFLGELGVDVGASIGDDNTVRAATTRSRISRQDRLVERYELATRAGFLWRALDFADDNGVANIFANPLSTDNDSTVAMYTLPNGLLGFAIFDAGGNRANTSDILLDTNQNDFRARPSTSCLNCHGGAGPLSVVDEVRPFVEANPGLLDPATVEAVLSIYPPPSVFDAIVDLDSSQYLTARSRAGAPVEGGGDPLAFVLLQFDADLTLASLAGDLFVSQSDFQANAALLPPELSAPQIDRDDFAALYLESACTLSQASENQPVGC